MIGNERGIREGMMVYSADGERLGKVRECQATGFFVEKGFFFPKEYFARYDSVASVDGDDVRLSHTKEMLWPAEGAATSDLGERDVGLRDRDEIRATRAEEELDVVKRQREAGEVRVRKDVVTETKHVDVPVTREEVHVERVPVSERRPAADEARFEKESMSIPVREEEVEIRKRPVVKEEIRVRKDRIEHEQRASADVRKEEIDIDDRTTGGRPLGTPPLDDDER